MNFISRTMIVMLTYSLTVTAAAAQNISGEALADALRDGGYVLLMRHAQSPRSTPDPDTASPGNVDLERQLDETGRQTAAAMGEAFRAMEIPIGEVLSSPTFRALETVRYAEFPDPQPVDELDSGRDEARLAWLRERAAAPPEDGTNRVMVTHNPNISGAFPEEGSGMSDGEALVLRPDRDGGATVVGRVPVEEWPMLVSP